MAHIPDHDYSVPQAEELKLYGVTYQYQLKSGDKFADTWHIKARSIFEALRTAENFCTGTLESGNWDAFEITSANVIR